MKKANVEDRSMKQKIIIPLLCIALSLGMLSGCVEIQQKEPTNNPPVAGFTAVIENQTATFTSTSTDPDNDTLTYAWDFGDGETSTEENPVHDYTENNKTYTVTLTVTDEHNESDTEIKPVTIGTPNTPPEADFTYLVNITTKTVTFYDNSSDLDNDPLTYSWDFGDGNSSNETNPVHTYAANNTYTVTLTVSDGKNNSTISKDVRVGNIPPKADFFGFPVFLDVVFANWSEDEDGEIVTWLWDFGDGNTSTDWDAYHEYLAPGNYSVTLTVTDNDGATNSTTEQITVTLE
jgi:PKD repeat protein